MATSLWLTSGPMSWIAHPTDARRYRKVHAAMMRIAKAEAAHLHQSYSRTAKTAFFQHARYAKAKQFKRARREQKRLKVCAGRLMRHVANHLSEEAYDRRKWTFMLSDPSPPHEKRTRMKRVERKRFHIPFALHQIGSECTLHRHAVTEGRAPCA